jgi:hypothetical protein
MRLPVDHHATHAADSLATVVIEGDRRLAGGEQLLVHHIQHLEKRHVIVDPADLVALEAAGVARIFLPPDVQNQVQSSRHGLTEEGALQRPSATSESIGSKKEGYL